MLGTPHGMVSCLLPNSGLSEEHPFAIVDISMCKLHFILCSAFIFLSYIFLTLTILLLNGRARWRDLWSCRESSWRIIQTDNRTTAGGGGKLGDGWIEQKGKRTHGHGQQCGDCWGKGEWRGLNGNGKKHNKNELKIKFKKEKDFQIIYC